MAWDQVTNALAGYGCTLHVSIDDGSTYKKIAEVRSLSDFGATAEVNDVSHTESPDGYREYIGGLKDGGEIGFELNFYPVTIDDTNYVDQDDLFGYLGTKYDWKITWTDTATTESTFKGILTRFNVGFDNGGSVTASAAIKIAGAITIAAA